MKEIIWLIASLRLQSQLAVRMVDPVRVCGLIDSLGPGGAQRQFVELMIGLAERGHQVTVLIYHQFTFFMPQLKAAGISVICTNTKTKIGRIFAVRNAIRDTQPNVVISFLDTPNIVAEICKLFSKSQYRLIVSERAHNPQAPKLRLMARLCLHMLANRIVSNSYSQHKYIFKLFPLLSKRISTIHNCVDLQRFVTNRGGYFESDQIRFIVVATYIDLKNPFRFLEAFARLVENNPTKDIQCDWYGNKYIKPGVFYPAYIQLHSDIDKLRLHNHFRLHPATINIEKAYQHASALCLPSLAEGCANAICEAMACGLPILASAVGDNAFLVNHRNSGLLFNPKSVDSIYISLKEFCDLTPSERGNLASRSRQSAEHLFARQQFLDQWEQLICCN